MDILAMLMRSILSYSIFLTSRKIVQKGAGFGESLKKNLELHRCENCWRLYSGEISSCNFCGEFCKPLYRVYEEDQYGPYNNSQEFEKREGIEKHVYNDTRNLKFEPLMAPKLEVKNDRYSRSPGSKPGNTNQRRNSSPAGYSNDDRRRSNPNSSRNTKLG